MYVKITNENRPMEILFNVSWKTAENKSSNYFDNSPSPLYDPVFFAAILTFFQCFFSSMYWFRKSSAIVF